jgi:tetratricopeptide (TPR) repeat protein
MLNRLLVQQPSNAEMLALRAHTYSHLQRPREAVADGEAAVRSGPTLAEAYLRRGEALMGENKLAEAIADFEKALKLNPNEVEAWGNLGASYNGLGQHQKGLDAINRGLKLPNPRYDLWFTRAVSYHAMGNHKAALDDLTEAIRLKPNSPMLLRGRAAVYRDAQQLELALRDANEALRVGPDDPEGLAIRGSIYVLLGNRDGAIADFRYALRLKPDFTDVSDALRQLEPAAEPAASSGGASPGITYARLLDDTATAIRGQRYAEANELIEQMIRLDPSRSDAWALRGLHAMNSLDNLPAAYESYQNALARGGSIYFRLAHDHGMDEVPCFGMLTVNRSGAVYAGETGGHQFQWDYAAVREAAMNEFYGSAAGMFHIKAQMPDGTKSFNFIVVRAVDQQIVNRRPDAEMLLGFLNRLKQSSGR